MANARLAAVLLLAVAFQAEAASDWYHKAHVRFHVFTKDTAHTTKGVMIQPDLDKQNVLASGFNPDLDTKVLIHGFSNGVTSSAMQEPKDAYFTVSDVNVMVVDWSDLNPAPLYLAGVGNVRGVGMRVAEVLDWMVAEGLVKLDRLHIVGHSLGAHVAGVAGHNMQSGRVARITGLDPARPLINPKDIDGCLSPDDAELVDVIHTNAGTLGQQVTTGHIDFFPNGGKSQPGCNNDFTGACSHGRSHELFAESILHPTTFTAWQCEDNWAALHKRCDQSSVIATMGEYLAFSKPGAYYLETASSSPYGSK